MKAKIRQFFRDERANSAVEYCILAGFLVVAMVVALALLGDGLQSLFRRMESNIWNEPQIM